MRVQVDPVSGPHHRTWRYTRAAKAVRNAANANPNAVCWRDGNTLAEHQRRNPNRIITWHAGHTRPASTSWTPWLQVTKQPPPGDWLAPEASLCNQSSAHTERRRSNRTSRPW